MDADNDKGIFIMYKKALDEKKSKLALIQRSIPEARDSPPEAQFSRKGTPRKLVATSCP